MAKGIIYVMTTAIDGLIKIGKTGSANFEQRMRFLENNGYRNINGLKRQFAIEVSDYDKKEMLLDSLFSRSRVSNTEIFSMNVNEVIQLLSSFEGKIVYPPQESKSEIFVQATEAVESALIPNGVYYLKTAVCGKGVQVNATMTAQNGNLTVLKGAVLGDKNTLTVENWKACRQSLARNGNVLAEDFRATSPSMAAAVVLGYHVNGWKKWENENGEAIDVYRVHLEESDN